MFSGSTGSDKGKGEVSWRTEIDGHPYLEHKVAVSRACACAHARVLGLR